METAQEFDGCGQHLWVCPRCVVMVPDGNLKKLEPMCTYHLVCTTTDFLLEAWHLMRNTLMSLIYRLLHIRRPRGSAI